MRSINRTDDHASGNNVVVVVKWLFIIFTRQMLKPVVALHIASYLASCDLWILVLLIVFLIWLHTLDILFSQFLTFPHFAYCCQTTSRNTQENTTAIDKDDDGRHIDESMDYTLRLVWCQTVQIKVYVQSRVTHVKI